MLWNNCLGEIFCTKSIDVLRVWNKSVVAGKILKKINNCSPMIIRYFWIPRYLCSTYVYMPAWLMELHRKLGTLLIDWSRHDRPAHHLLSNFCYQCHSSFFSLLTLWSTLMWYQFWHFKGKFIFEKVCVYKGIYDLS